MEQARLFMAIALSIIVFIVWDHFFVPKQPASQAPPSTQETVNTNPSNKPILTHSENGINDPASAERESIVTDQLNPIVEKEPRTITISTPAYHIKISERGAVITSFTLNDYFETKKSHINKEVISSAVSGGTLRSDMLNNSIPGLDNALFETDAKTDSIIVEKDTVSVSFRWHNPNGFSIAKTFNFKPEGYIFTYSVNIVNNSNATLDDSLEISFVDAFPENGGYAFEGPCALIDNHLEEVKAKKIKTKNIYTGELEWIAVQDRYFMSSIIPEMKQDLSMHLNLNQSTRISGSNISETYNIIDTRLVQMIGAISPGNQKTLSYDIYMGPKSVRILKGSGYRLDKAVNFGWFDFLAKPCLWLMNVFYDFIPNYGLAIIFLTILIKILFWPLGTKAYKSMNEMKKLQPLMAEINEKYKSDPQKKNQEVMALYKTYKVNPLGGCLPMLVQMPIFLALYKMLYSAIELRHAPFFGWITDLSAPDRLFNFGVVIPFFEPPTGIPVLTLIMGASMFIQQKMSPPAGDPSQAKMMMMMPLFMTVIFINFSSGLVLYWLINNILSIAQQYYITKNNN
ncbi:MAG: membrane protein insertase YidC [Proteobacteria bacterium]|nr:membrane protein insertase YidC [Pseudomonadota bacterium]